MGISVASDIPLLGVANVFPQPAPAGVTVYESGPDISNLNRIAGPDLTRTFGSSTSFEALAGTTYLLAFDGYPENQGWPNTFSIHVFQPALKAPQNDELVSAREIPKLEEPIYFDLGRATVQPDEPGFGTWAAPTFESPTPSVTEWVSNGPKPRGGNSVWFLWRADADGHYLADVRMPAGFPQVAVFRIRSQAGPPWNWADLEPATRVENGNVRWISSFPGIVCDARTRVGANLRALAGEWFAIQVDQLSPAGDFTPGTWPPPGQTWVQPRGLSFGSITLTPNTANDDFDQAFPLMPPATASVFSFAPSFEPGEPPLPGASGSLWWRWTAPSDSWVSPSGVVDVFQGDRLDTLQAVPLQPLPPPSRNLIPRFFALSGTTYSFRSIPNDSNYSFANLLLPASNDQFLEAAEIPWGTWTVSTPPGLASMDPGEPPLMDARAGGIVWFHWTPQRSGRFLITSDTYLRIFRGDHLDLLERVGRDAAGGELLDVEAGVKYRFCLDKPDSNGRISFPAIAANDDFEKRILLAQTGSTQLDSILATAEPGEPDHGGQPAHASIWYDWRPPTAGRIGLIVRGEGRPRLAVYRGDSLATLQPVAQSQTAADSSSAAAVIVESLPGETLRLAVEPGRLTPPNLNRAPGVLLQWSGPPANDGADAAAALSPVSRRGSTLAAGSDEVDALATGRTDQSTVWYRGQIQTAGFHVVRLTSLGSFARVVPASLRVFRGRDPGHLTLIALSAPLASATPAVARFPADGGETIWVQVSTEAEHPDVFDIELVPASFPQVSAPVVLRPGPGPAQLSLLGTDRQIVHIEQSSDLQHWEVVGDAQIQGILTTLDLRGTPAESLRFIRAVVP